MCERLAAHGYYVPAAGHVLARRTLRSINLKEAFKDEESRHSTPTSSLASTDPERSTRDTGAFLDWLALQPQVKPGKVGCTGYCMGGGPRPGAAENFPDRVASPHFHGGRLATDAPDSPHLLAPKIRAKVYVGGADEDAGFPPEQADRLRDALTAAGVDNTVEIYQGARHGYAPPDMPVYNEAAAERHWRELFKLLAGTLK